MGATSNLSAGHTVDQYDKLYNFVLWGIEKIDLMFVWSIILIYHCNLFLFPLFDSKGEKSFSKLFFFLCFTRWQNYRQLSLLKTFSDIRQR